MVTDKNNATNLSALCQRKNFPNEEIKHSYFVVSILSDDLRWGRILKNIYNYVVGCLFWSISCGEKRK